MNGTVALSVVIPLFNKRHRIGATLTSVLRQTRAPNEIIVVNDGSTDGGDVLVRQRFGDRVRVVDQENGGVSRARNTGIDAACHEYICLLDADDEWEPSYLAEMESLIRHFPRAQMYAVGMVLVDHGIRSFLDAGVPEDFTGELDFFKSYDRAIGIVSSSSVCIRRSNYDQGIRFPEGAGVGEDIYYWIRTAELGPMAFSARRLSIIHRDENAPSFRSRVTEIPYYIRWASEQLADVADGEQRKYIRRMLRRHALKSALLAVQMGEPGYVGRLAAVLRRRHPVLATAVRMMGLVPPRAILLARRARRRLA